MEIKFNNVHELKIAHEAGQIEVPRFVGIRNYCNQRDEISNYLINCGIAYRSLLESDAAFINFVDLSVFDFATNIDDETATTAFDEIRQSINQNISDNIEHHSTMSRVQLKLYDTILPNIKVHKQTGVTYLTGYVVNKQIIRAGHYPTVNSRPKTIAKNTIKRQLRTSKYRQFLVHNIGEIRLNGNTLQLQLDNE